MREQRQTSEKRHLHLFLDWTIFSFNEPKIQAKKQKQMKHLLYDGSWLPQLYIAILPLVSRLLELGLVRHNAPGRLVGEAEVLDLVGIVEKLPGQGCWLRRLQAQFHPQALALALGCRSARHIQVAHLSGEERPKQGLPKALNHLLAGTRQGLLYARELRGERLLV